MLDLLDIVGQDAVLAQLQRAAGSDRRPHAYLFAGPRGVGRRTTAIELARWMLCQKPATQANAGRLAELPKSFALRQACGACPSCTAATAGTSPDLQLIRKELALYHDDSSVRGRKMQELSIEVIRQFLIDPAHLASTGGRGKVFIVLEADLLSIPAQNALLKTLEEPPADVTIILACSRPEDLLPTTRSRCQIVRFAPLPADFIVEQLTAGGVAEAQGRFWAAMTEGSLGRSDRLAKTDLYDFKRELVDRLAGLSAGGSAQLAEMLVGAMEKRAKALVAEAKSLAGSVASRRAGEFLLVLLGSVYRDALRLACGVEAALVHADQQAAVAAVAERFGPEGLAEILGQLSRYEQLLWRNVNAKLLWDNVAITCVSATPLGV